MTIKQSAATWILFSEWAMGEDVGEGESDGDASLGGLVGGYSAIGVLAPFGGDRGDHGSNLNSAGRCRGSNLQHGEG
jgi:hypothetical protein